MLNKIDKSQFWLRLSARLRAELGEDLYTSWFARMELDELDETGRVVFSVSTRFLKSWIENHYITKVKAIAQAELGSPVSVVMRVRGTPVPVRPRAVVPEPQTPLMEPRDLPQDFPTSSDETLTFETFVVGASNMLAHAAASRVAASTAVNANPLYIHAAAGLGKTHLLNAISHRVKQQQPHRRVLMLSAERFMYFFIQALRQRNTLAFKDQFQAIDLLLIDDFQFLKGGVVQQEFCHAFNSLLDSRRQVVIAADVPPPQLDSIDQRMRSRLLGGLMVDIEIPDEHLRRQIVARRYAIMKAIDPGLVISEDVLDLIALRVMGAGRELEGALNRLAVHQQVNGNNRLTPDLAAMVLRDAGQAPDQGKIKIDDIMKVVGRHFNVQKADLLSPRRARSVVVPRQIGMYLSKKLTSRSLPEIGRKFGGRDHSTVLHAVRKIDERMRVDDKLAKDVALLIRLCEQG
jgi:chromosomal replication initiator protein